MKELFDKFTLECRYIRNLTDNTLDFYYDCFHVFDLQGAFANLSKKSVEEAIIALRQKGVKPGAVNSYVRGLRVFLNWLHSNGHISQKIEPPVLRREKPVLKIFSEAQLSAILNYKSANVYERRLVVLLSTLADTGIRINEAFGLKKEDVDLDNLLMLVTGKGRKQRIVPFSVELRKVLYRWMKSHKHDYVFCNRKGGLLRYDNMRGDFYELLAKLKIEATSFDGAFHAFRRSFATNYIRNKGNPMTLQRLLGHTTLSQTNEYVKLVTDDLQHEQHRTSLLNRLKR